MNATRPHVVHVTLAHEAHDVRIFEKEAVTLAAAGFNVSLIAPGAPSGFEKGVRMAPMSPRASIRGVRAGAGRLWAVVQTLRSMQPDIVHLHDPELIPVGLWLAAFGKKIIYDAHEDAPLEARTLNAHRPRRGWALELFWRANLAAARATFSAFVVATPEIANRFASRNPVLVRNYPQLDQLRPGPTVHAARPRRVAYVGNISRARGLMELLDAMASLPATDEAELALVGTFRPIELEAMAREHPGWARVRYQSWATWPEVSRILDTCRVGICALHPTPELMTSLPVKLFEYMAKGLPVIASNFPTWRPLLGDAGHWIDPLSVVALSDAIKTVLDHPVAGQEMGRSGAERVRANFSWKGEGEKLISLYQKLL